jgi:hypothetical protein
VVSVAVQPKEAPQRGREVIVECALLYNKNPFRSMPHHLSRKKAQVTRVRSVTPAAITAARGKHMTVPFRSIPNRLSRLQNRGKRQAANT